MRRSPSEAIQDHLLPIFVIKTYGATNLGTTPTKVVPGSDRAGVRLVRILNGSASNRLGVMLVEKDAAAPTGAASFANDSALIILAERELEITVRPNVDIYLVGSAASTSYQVAVIER